jgi:hypothetical protein
MSQRLVGSSATTVKNTVPIYSSIVDSAPLSEVSPPALRPHELMKWRQGLGLL